MGMALFMLIMGCVTMGPDYRRPEPDFRMPAQYRQDTGSAQGEMPDEKWWRLFGDSDLDRMVDEALDNNLDILKAVERILEVQAQLIQTRADRFPTVNVQGQTQRQQRAVDSNLSGVPTAFQGLVERVIDTRTLSLPASFELDLWGRFSRAEEAVRADLVQAAETAHTVAQGVVSETISLYFQVDSLERRIEIAEKRITHYQKSLKLVEDRYQRGIASILDVRQARRILTQAESALPQLRQDLGVAHQKLSLLLGRYPKTAGPRAQPENYYQKLSAVPPGLPSDLLVRRPDVRAAEARLEGLNARIGVARAARFPRISLTGSFGYSSEALSGLFQPESELWSLAAGVAQPVFDAGRLKAGEKGAASRYRQAVSDYAKTLLTAFFEVESALLTREEQERRRGTVMEFLNEARATQEVAENRYLRGLVDYLTVLEAMQTRFQAEENLVLVELTILQNRVTLHRALGGGWADPLTGKIE
jgi:multidrug efflux system outer membrane protein